MPFKKNNSLFEANNLIDLYIVLSFAISIFLWIGEYSLIDNFVGQSFFPSLLVLGNYFFFRNVRGNIEQLKEHFHIPVYFLFQIICVIGTSFQFDQEACLFLAFIPCLCGSFHFIYQFHNTDQRSYFQRAFGLTALFAGICFVFYGLNPTISFGADTVLFLISFCLWSQGMMYLGGEFINLKQKSLFSRVFKLSKLGKHSTNVGAKDKYFFHDLINHTHSINLFLSVKKEQGLQPSECEIVKNEVKVLQSLIKDHFSLGHKNLDDVYDYVPFDIAKHGLFNMVENYLPENKVRCHFVFTGLLHETIAFKNRSYCKIHYPSFYRIMNNLIKNISEQNSREAEFIFDYQDEGLSIIVKNRILTLKDNRKELAGNLKKMILNHNNSVAGIGLESVQTLCEELGGDFIFHIEGDYWISEVFIPRSISDGKSLAA
jgi:hypothetical protein